MRPRVRFGSACPLRSIPDVAACRARRRFFCSPRLNFALVEWRARLRGLSLLDTAYLIVDLRTHRRRDCSSEALIMKITKALLLFTTISAAAITAVPASAQQSQRPNIVVIWGDDIGQ